MAKPRIINELKKAVLSRDPARVQKILAGLDPAGTAPEQVLKGLTAGMEEARKRLGRGTCSIPEFLLIMDAFRGGVELMKAWDAQVPRREESVVIGVVQGDVHDMGKNIVAGVLEASGYPVHDLGKDVPRDRFLEALEETGAGVLALSTMMSTPLAAMRDVISWTRRLHPDVRILVGGAPLDEVLARSMGADGYAEGAADVPEEIGRVLSGAKRKMKIPVMAKT